MNRRSFLASLLATAVLDPERLLWVQKKTIFIPPAPVLIDKLYGVDLEYSYVDLTLASDDFRTRYIKPATERYMSVIEAQYRKGRLGRDVGFEWYSELESTAKI